MSFRLKIFIFLFLIVSTTMLLSYLYGIRIVETDRRNFINEYIVHRSYNLSQKLSGIIDSLSLLSESLCLMGSKDADRINDIEDFVKNYLLVNRAVRGLYFQKGSVVVRYNSRNIESVSDGNEQMEIRDGLAVIKNKKGDCIFSAGFSLDEFAGEKDIFESVVFFIGNSQYIKGKPAGYDIDDLRVRAEEMSSKSASGVFVYGKYVLGYSSEKANRLLVLVVLKRDVFENAIISLRYRILIAGLFSLVVFLILGFLIAGRITRPMRLLKEKAQLIKKGVFERVAAVRGSDEVGEAVDAFNKMVDDLREKEENLKQSQMKLVQAEKMSAFGQLSAGIAHEVKNPLTSVLGYIQLARRYTQDEKINEYLRIAENETLRCKQILEDLLKFARMDRHQKAEIDLREVVVNTIRLVNHQMMMKKIRLTSDMSEERIIISGNANQIQQVILNILLNAMQSIERKGNSDGLVTVSAGREEGFVFVSVRDNGEGIAEENLGKIFEPFFTTKAETGGTGLGLSISFGIIKEHNGEIKVNSKLGEGTEFRIYLPLQSALC